MKTSRAVNSTMIRDPSRRTVTFEPIGVALPLLFNNADPPVPSLRTFEIVMVPS